MRSKIYRMCKDGKEYVGTAKEIASVSGYNAAYFGMVTRGELPPRKDITIECIGEIPYNQGSYSDIKFAEEWERTTALFKNVIWVSEDCGEGRRLEVTR